MSQYIKLRRASASEQSLYSLHPPPHAHCKELYLHVVLTRTYLSHIAPVSNPSPQKHKFIYLLQYHQNLIHPRPLHICMLPDVCSTMRAPGVLSSAFSLNASARQGVCKRSLFKSIDLSPENQRWLP